MAAAIRAVADDDFVEQRGSMHDLNPKKLGPARYFNAILYTLVAFPPRDATAADAASN